VAALLAVLLVALLVKTTQKRDAEDLSDGLNPVYMTSKSHTQFSLAPATGVAIANVADPGVAPAALTKRGDRLWAEFRRCIAFDYMYFGNKILALDDGALEDVYAILAVTCPTRSFFDPLRGVGQRFLKQHADSDSSDIVLDDVVDFIEKALPDVLVERAIDMCALIASSRQNPDTAAADFSDMFDDYVPEENIYLAPSLGGSWRGLSSDAAHRELHQVDPLYYEPDELTDRKEDEYAAVCEYATAGQVGFDAIYDQGSSSDPHAIYDTASGPQGYVQNDLYDNNTDPTYGVATAASGDDPMYSLGSFVDNNEDIYGIASGAESAVENSTNLAPNDALYSTASPGESTVDPTYGLATGSPVQTADGTYGVGGDVAVYDNGVGLATGPSEPVYDTGAASESVRRPPGFRRQETDWGLLDSMSNSAGERVTAADLLYDNMAPVVSGTTSDDKQQTVPTPVSSAPYATAEPFDSRDVPTVTYDVAESFEASLIATAPVTYDAGAADDTMTYARPSKPRKLSKNAIGDSNESMDSLNEIRSDSYTEATLNALDAAALEHDFLEMEQDLEVNTNAESEESGYLKLESSNR